MTNDSGQIATYVDEVRAALGDLPASRRDDLLEDLPAHLSEVAAEDPSTPLRERLGSPATYAAELRAALEPAAAGRPRQAWAARWAASWERLRDRLAVLDQRGGRLLGYERVSEFARLLVPAWWVLRGYLAAMVVAAVLDNRGRDLGLLPRLGGSTIAGIAILAGFIAGSVWLARRTRALNRWQRQAMGVATAALVVFGLAGFISVDENERWDWGPSTYVSVNPYENVQDVYPVDENGRLLTGVRLIDQEGNPLDIGWDSCDNFNWYDEASGYTYPRCPENAPWWMPAPSELPPTPIGSPGLAE
jgi:hypothetical protein